MQWVQAMKDQPCVNCKLSRGRKNIVLFRGNPEARLMAIGEAPGREEDLTGSAFVGQAGQLGDRMFKYIDIDTNCDLYLCNVVKCRPPSNRDPEPEEIEACAPYLNAQIAMIKPRAIVVLGKVAAVSLGLIQKKHTLKTIIGQWLDYKNIPTIVIYHPAFLLRNASMKRQQALLLDKIKAHMQQEW
jgi:uracil-DNA glycosylase